MTKIFTLAAAAVLLAASGAASAAPDGKNRKILIENNSSLSVRELYASPITATGWEEDLLGLKTLPVGESIKANVDNGTDECYYDLKAVFDGGKAYEKRKVNVCAVSTWTLGDYGNTIE